MTSLSVVSYIERINRMYRLIRKEVPAAVRNWPAGCG